MSNYTDDTLISTYLKRDLTPEEHGTLSILMPAVKLWIDKYTNTTFDEASSSTRYFDSDGGEIIDIDPVSAVTAIASVDDDGVVNYTYTLTTEYLLEPVNETIKSELRRRVGCWPHGAQRIAVTGKFSRYNAGVPQDIKMAATKICADMLNAGGNDASNIKSESIEGHSITYRDPNETIDKVAVSDPTVISILTSYKGVSLG